MQKQEFEALAGKEVPDRDYRVIEYVYQFHPLISETSGKEEVAELWKSFGTPIFYDMLPRARAADRLESQIRSVRVQLEALQEQYRRLKDGEMPEDAAGMEGTDEG